ncbi:hypothetical protein SAMN05421823_108268 [Catalinimonas alkaloidigena]|uniref:Outer membrane protein transport protein (OMPP1/FadL/TodX) n=1 Tax=Catalinimonas alkaloidigena TaxID=1075417 RepID=A0A1G9NEP0_9BACT|nr:hypothetical protein [Catalinimonas alkaloidigena]SDL84843.1 hypothetical protein SAMN05421823_108268 [Catalinimonas alkaloidigena]
MNLRRSIFVLGLSGLSTLAFAQTGPEGAISIYHTDALRYSYTGPGGTSRTLGMGGAQTALGADISSLSINPAGLGVFRQSEFSITPAFSLTNINSRYAAGENRQLFDANVTDDNFSNLNFPSMGVVFTNIKDDIVPGAWRGGSWGMSLTRLNSFNQNFSFSGVNRNSAPGQANSLVDYYLQVAQGQPAGQLEGLGPDVTLPFNVFLIDTLGGEGSFVPTEYIADASTNPYTLADLVPISDMDQRGTIERNGAQYQFDIGYGGNFEDKLYFGFGAGIGTVRFREVLNYSETPVNVSSDFSFQGVQLMRDLQTNGTGINFKAGLIYRLTDWVRLGGSVQSPTFFAMREQSNYTLSAQYADVLYNFDANGQEVYLSDFGNGAASFQGSAPTTNYNYSMTTPFRATGGISIFAGKNGFVAADVEYVNYTSARVRDSNGSMDIDNIKIGNIAQSALNFRIGGEYRYDMFRVRAGYSLYGSPYRENTVSINQSSVGKSPLSNLDVQGSTQSFSGGLGLRLEDFYVDLAAIYSLRDSHYFPYQVRQGTGASAMNDLSSTTVSVSIGSFF